MAQQSKEPCKKEACDIQACLSKNNFLPQKIPKMVVVVVDAHQSGLNLWLIPLGWQQLDFEVWPALPLQTQWIDEM
ncbi:hypothetical protein TSUD_204290 [Trifolium subterraneum]|uniref:Uncharacterized protein n=1 Tax=Trifolium subterraneum TaxID=3900 RepID=A0A2Z6PGS4_TRISU|nr:hypothetical protein TSUD_204290 [Trifolium subterraneum]